MNEDSSEGEQSQKQSKFNSTIAILMRIDILWKDAHHHSRAGSYDKWNIDLDRVWCELAADVEEGKDDDKKFDTLNETINNIGFKKPINPKTGARVLINKCSLYMAIMKKEIFLRKLQNKQGKGVAYEESIEDYMD